MKSNKRYRMPLKRRREGKTDYRQRLRLLKSGKPRIVVRQSNKHVRVQFVMYDETGDVVATAASGTHLADYGWEGSMSNMPACYLAGLLAGKRALANDVSEGVLDIGHHPAIPGSNVFGVLRGVLDAGVDVPHGDEVLPDEKRIYGEHISDSMPDQVKATVEKIEADYE
ncbi:MAG: 50S ribosomal protein L18 [Candidatus Thermoplasmatota archaeon]|nr:50S ribosomal protein L18 [Candidatus Thermoplasmatota archaeon]